MWKLWSSAARFTNTHFSITALFSGLRVTHTSVQKAGLREIKRGDRIASKKGKAKGSSREQRTKAQAASRFVALSKYIRLKNVTA
jgi:hypothetical protein